MTPPRSPARPAIDPFAVPVAGGELGVAWLAGQSPAAESPGAESPAAESPAAPRPVLAVHGITSNSRCWVGVADALAGRAALAAVDLRGRGDSRTLPPPYGFAAHQADLLAVLDALGPRPPVLVGHSLGAYLVAQLAADHPDRVGAVVLVDGGLALSAPDGVDPDQAAAIGLRPALARFSLTFASAGAYELWWRRHPAFVGGRADRAVLAVFAAHDLTGAPPELRPAVAEEAVREDLRGVFAAGAAAAALTPPATLLVAPRGLLDDPDPLQPLARAEAWAAARDDRRAALVPDVNHYTIVMGRSGAAAVADAIAELV